MEANRIAREPTSVSREDPIDAPIVQAKLDVGSVDDPLEREADLIAARVVAGMSQWSGRPSGARDDRVRRAPTGTEGRPTVPPVRAAARVRRMPTSTPIGRDGGSVDHETESRIRRASGGGRPLDPQLRRSMEGGFGVALDRVRVHTDAQSNDLSERIQAKAFTTGSDIFFRSGEYQPGTRTGQHLLAHELTHVVQQGAAGLQRKPEAIHRLFGRKKKAKPPTGRVSASFKLAEAVRAFEIGDDGVMTSSASRTSLDEGTAVYFSNVDGKPERAVKEDGKESAFVHCRVGTQHFAVPESAVKKAKSGKAGKRAKKAAKHTNTAAGLLATVSGARTDVLTADGKVKAKSGAATAGGTSQAGQLVDTSNMSQAELDVYNDANFYESTGSAVTAAGSAFGSWFSTISQMKGFYDNWSTMNKKEKANAIADGFGSVVSTAAATSELMTQAHISANQSEYDAGNLTSSFGKRPVKVAGPNGALVSAKENYQATDLEKGSMALGMIAGGVSAALKIKDAIVNFVKWAKKFKKKDQKGNLAREGVDTLKSFGDAAKSTMNTVLEVRKFFEGSTGVAWQAMPIFGLVMNAIEVVRRGMAIHRARMDGKSVKRDKKSAKERFTQWWPAAEKMDHKLIRLKRKQLEDRAGTEREQPQDEERIDAIDEYLLDRDLANTANKRRNRAILGIIVEAQSIAANISTLAGQAHVSVGFKISGAATGLGATGLRKVKQFGRDRGWKGFNKNKTTDKKNARYGEIAERLYADFISIHGRFEGVLQQTNEGYTINSAKDFDKAVANEISKDHNGLGLSAQAIQNDNARLKGRVKAAGLSWREFCAENDPVKRFQMLIDGQKKRE